MKKIPLLACILLLLSSILPHPVAAARGAPDSLHFGYGLRLDVNGEWVEESLVRAAEMGLDWVALDFDWNSTWPDPSAWDSSTPFSRAARLADTLGLTLVFSIHNPPAWAMTANGPHPELTAALLCDLKQLFPTLQAVELYPRANTRFGWGASPSATHYAALLQITHERIESKGIYLHLLAGGLTNQLSSPEDLLDTVFLQELYNAGANPAIVSLRLDQMDGDPLSQPAATTLRHFEQIRSIMTANSQSEALLWVTGFNLPCDLEDADAKVQSDWLEQSYQLMRSRLYFGAAFYTCYNDSAETPGSVCLLRRDGSHEFLSRLRFLVGEN